MFMLCWRQVDRLEKQLLSALDGLNRQKENAHRWMSRQKVRAAPPVDVLLLYLLDALLLLPQIRLMAQANAVNAERAVMADLVHLERTLFKALSDKWSAVSNGSVGI